MGRDEILDKIRVMLAIAEEIKEGTREIWLIGDIDRITAILKEKIRLIDPSDFDLLDYFDAN